MQKRTLWSVALVSAITLTPYGNVDQLLGKRNPWTTFRSEDPILVGVRINRHDVTDCAPWVQAFVNDTRQTRRGKPHSTDFDAQWSTWFPLEKDEREAIEDCHDQPCAVKLGNTEVTQMAQTPKEDRLKEYLSLVLARAADYEKSGVRASYEYPGGITDPWKYFDENGFKSMLEMPKDPGLGLRKLDFHNSRIRPIRQLVDRRVSEAKDGHEASIWIRDVYTSHYFDSWGEWGDISCDPDKHEITAVLAVYVEFDVLKNTGFFASISRGSARGSMQTLTENYLDQWWAGIKVTAEKSVAAHTH